MIKQEDYQDILELKYYRVTEEVSGGGLGSYNKTQQKSHS